ncbi:MAG: metallophosphoesterase family protein [Planctomycetota bacterium]
MKIGLISDTHISDASQPLPSEIFQVFRDADLILHAGDLVILPVLEELARLAPTQAVRGNMDHEECDDLPLKRVIEAGGVRVGLTHGAGGPRGIADRALKQFHGDGVGAVVFGHSHQALMEERDSVLIVNPGSPTDSRWAAYHSVAVLEIEKGKVQARIVRI